jgi:hypothetical protein
MSHTIEQLATEDYASSNATKSFATSKVQKCFGKQSIHEFKESSDYLDMMLNPGEIDINMSCRFNSEMLLKGDISILVKYYRNSNSILKSQASSNDRQEVDKFSLYQEEPIRR